MCSEGRAAESHIGCICLHIGYLSRLRECHWMSHKNESPLIVRADTAQYLKRLYLTATPCNFYHDISYFSMNKMLDEENFDSEAYSAMAKSVELMYNAKSAKMKIRGHDGFVSHVDNEIAERNCPRQKAYNQYADAMKKLLLSDKQLAAA